MGTGSHRAITILSVVLIASLAIASYYGAFLPATYARDSASMGAQGMGQDLFDLFSVVPLLAITLAFASGRPAIKRNRISLFIFAGSLFYVSYSFFIYSFGVHFNNLFLLYCLVLGSSLYAFLLTVYKLNDLNVREWFGEQTPLRATAVYFIVVAVLFYLLWLKDVIPAILTGSIPAGVTDNKLLVNPVHVLDLAIALPGLIATALLLFQKHQGWKYLSS